MILSPISQYDTILCSRFRFLYRSLPNQFIFFQKNCPILVFGLILLRCDISPSSNRADKSITRRVPVYHPFLSLREYLLRQNYPSHIVWLSLIYRIRNNVCQIHAPPYVFLPIPQMDQILLYYLVKNIHSTIPLHPPKMDCMYFYLIFLHDLASLVLSYFHILLHQIPILVYICNSRHSF